MFALFQTNGTNLFFGNMLPKNKSCACVLACFLTFRYVMSPSFFLKDFLFYQFSNNSLSQKVSRRRNHFAWKLFHIFRSNYNRLFFQQFLFQRNSCLVNTFWILCHTVTFHLKWWVGGCLKQIEASKIPSLLLFSHPFSYLVCFTPCVGKQDSTPDMAHSIIWKKQELIRVLQPSLLFLFFIYLKYFE